MEIERASFADITDGLDTKSEKIRALAKADYSRVEIASLLNIRYQHVRKVLVDAGISKGLKILELEVDRSPVVVELADEASFATTRAEYLTEAGFESLGTWSAGLADGDIVLSAKPPNDPGVYAFVLDGAVVYVGLTQSGLKNRLDQYRRGDERQKTNSRVKQLIARALAEGKNVGVLIARPTPLEWQSLPVNTAAGLEMGLIKSIKPLWNIVGAT